MIIKELTLKQVDHARVCLYTFFSRLFNDQTKAEDLAAYAAHLEPVTGPYAAVAQEITVILDKWSAMDDHDHKLRTEYARLLIMPAGVKPYESVYRSNEAILMREPWLEVKDFYRRSGLVLEKPAPHPEDHVSVELAFMAYLLENNVDVTEQKIFFENHIVQWLPQLFKDLLEHGDAGFFAEMAACSLNFMELEKGCYAAIPAGKNEETE